jgi:peroxisomal 2,4-dienoyl-CoA reductase
MARAADVRDAAAVTEMVAAVAAELGRIDILINGAAGNFICLAENLSPNGFGTVVDIDLKGTFNVSRAALQYLRAQGGSVINISATLPYLGTMGQAHASAAKAGVDSLTRTLAVEWGPHRIRVNGIAPGPVLPHARQSQAEFDAKVASLPLKRAPELAEFGRTVRWLWETKSVTGQVIAVDGGQHLAVPDES